MFLLYGVVNVFFAIYVPTTLHSKGAGGTDALIVSAEADSKVLGRTLTSLPQADPGLSDFLVAIMDTMSMMMAFAILQVAIAWFALRRGHSWTLWVLAIADLSFISYFLAWSSIFSQYDVTLGDALTSSGGLWIMVVVWVVIATLAGWFGMRRSGMASGGIGKGWAGPQADGVQRQQRLLAAVGLSGR
ncbi:MAG: hypothetical protein EXR55_03120 [Dehalococcoidia bacterium]|nr:hypothetical protein [Dehalococcoidia bacterium]